VTWRRWAGLGVALVLVLASGGYAVAQVRDRGPSYRTAIVTRDDVQRTMSLSGTIAASGRRDLSFEVAGTVATVAVRPGQHVRAGQVVARLQTTSLEAAVTRANATMAKASAQLAADEDAQSSTVTTSAATSATTTASASGSGTTTKKPRTQGSGTSSGGQALAALQQEQHAVTSAQSAAGQAISAARDALAAQQSACSSTTPDPSASPSPSASSSASPSAPPGTYGTSGTSGTSAQCSDALAAVESAQDTVAQRQITLASALTALSSTLQKASATTAHASTQQGSSGGKHPTSSAGSSTASSSGSSAGSSTGSSSAKAAGSGGGGSTQGAVTAARLAQDQADIDSASAELTSARAQRAAANLQAPFAGRILEVPVARGDAVGTSDTVAVLLGSGVTTVATSVSAAQRPVVRRGQQASVVVAGAARALPASLSAIGLLPSSSGSYPVTLTVSTDQQVPEGSTVSVLLVTGLARGAVTVPTSAVTLTGRSGATSTSVEVLSSGTVTRTPVTVGVVGQRRTSITRGLRIGQTVVLADLGASVPSSTTTNRGRFGGGFGGGLGGPGSFTVRRAPGS